MSLHKPFHFPSLNVLTHSGFRQTGRPSKNDINPAEQVSDNKAEAWERFLIRAVPLLCGALLGSQFDLLLFGLFLGLVVSVQFDLQLKDQSLIRSWMHAKPARPRRVHGHFFNHR